MKLQYVSNDGEKFDTQIACERHEKQFEIAQQIKDRLGIETATAADIRLVLLHITALRFDLSDFDPINRLNYNNRQEPK